MDRRTLAPAWARLLTGILVTAVVTPAVAQAPAPASRPASWPQVRDAWLSADAVVLGRYHGVDPEHGEPYHLMDVEQVWMGSPSPGRLRFKAPRGVRAVPAQLALMAFWEELNGATYAYLQSAVRRYGERASAMIGPDSLTSYLLPFSRYAFGFVEGKIDLRGTSVFRKQRTPRELHEALLEFEATLAPPALFARSDRVVRARATRVTPHMIAIEEVPVEYRLRVDFEVLEVLKGAPADTLTLDYPSFPRSPRFDAGDEVILFLSHDDDQGDFLEYGKRAVYHVLDGRVGEVDQPLAEFVKALRPE